MKPGAGFGGLWRDRQFRTFWSAQTVSEFGDRISELALPLIAVTLLNATPTEVGLLTAAVWVPNIISLFVGSWVDQRPDKRPLMIAADSIFADLDGPTWLAQDRDGGVTCADGMLSPPQPGFWGS